MFVCVLLFCLAFIVTFFCFVACELLWPPGLDLVLCVCVCVCVCVVVVVVGVVLFSIYCNFFKYFLACGELLRPPAPWPGGWGSGGHLCQPKSQLPQLHKPSRVLHLHQWELPSQQLRHSGQRLRRWWGKWLVMIEPLSILPHEGRDTWGTLVGELRWSDQHWYRLPFWKECSGNFQLVFGELWLSFQSKHIYFSLSVNWIKFLPIPLTLPPPPPPTPPHPYLHPNFDFLARNMTDYIASLIYPPPPSLFLLSFSFFFLLSFHLQSVTYIQLMSSSVHILNWINDYYRNQISNLSNLLPSAFLAFFHLQSLACSELC